MNMIVYDNQLYAGKDEYMLQALVCFTASACTIGLIWTEARAMTEILNLVVSQYVVNQTCGYWLLSDAIARVLQLIVQIEAQQLQYSTTEPLLEYSEFESELEILYERMAGEVVTVL